MPEITFPLFLHGGVGSVEKYLVFFSEFVYYDTISYFVKVNEAFRYGKNVTFNAEDTGQGQP